MPLQVRPRINKRLWRLALGAFIIFTVNIVYFLTVVDKIGHSSAHVFPRGEFHSRGPACVVAHSGLSSEGQRKLEGKRALKAVLVSTYVPRICGIATFAFDLRRSLLEVLPHGSVVDVVAMIRKADDHIAPEAKISILENDIDEYRMAASWIDTHGYDVVLLQHEYGIYGGIAGSYVLDLVKRLQTPVIVTAHTVEVKPDVSTRTVLSELASMAVAIVNIDIRGCSLFSPVYGSGGKCTVIPHGIPEFPFISHTSMHKSTIGVPVGETEKGRPVILSFGLLGAGKGLEEVIGSMVTVKRRVPGALLIILGRPHPTADKNYVENLKEMVELSDLSNNVEFHTFFASDEHLRRYLAATDVFVTYYPGMNQASSGTLSISLGAGIACVSSPYVYAKSLLADGRGMLVDFGLPEELGATIADLLTDEEARTKMRCSGYQYTRPFVWKNVALGYSSLMYNVTVSGRNPRSRYSSASASTSTSTSMELAAEVLTFLDNSHAKMKGKLRDDFLDSALGGRKCESDLQPQLWSSAITQPRIEAEPPLNTGNWESQGIRNGVISLNYDINRGRMECEMRGRHGDGPILSGITFGVVEVVFEYEMKKYVQKLSDQITIVKTVIDSDGRGTLVVKTKLVANRGVETVGVVTTEARLSPTLSSIDTTYTIDIAKGVTLQGLIIVTATGAMEGNRGPLWDLASFYAGADRVHHVDIGVGKGAPASRTAAAAISKKWDKASSSSFASNDWLAIHGSAHSGAVFSRVSSFSLSSLMRSGASTFAGVDGNGDNDVRMAYDMHIHTLSHAKRIVFSEHTMLVSRAWRPLELNLNAFPNVNVNASANGGCDGVLRNPSEPANVGLVLHALVSLGSLGPMSKGGSGNESACIDRLVLGKLGAMTVNRTHMLELRDAVDAALALQERKIDVDIDKIIEGLVNMMLELEYRGGRGGFACHFGGRPHLVCNAAALYGLAVSHSNHDRKPMIPGILKQIKNELEADTDTRTQTRSGSRRACSADAETYRLVAKATARVVDSDSTADIVAVARIKELVLECIHRPQ